MSNEMSPDLITLLDDEGKEHEFEILDVVENEDGTFYALLPYDSSKSLDSDETYYIFEVLDQDGEQILAEVENDELLDKLANTFEARFEDLYEFNDSSEKF